MKNKEHKSKEHKKKSDNKTTEKKKREHRMTFLLSEDEKRVVDWYVKKHSIENRSNWLRALTLQAIHQHLEEDLPMLFSEYEMRR